MQRDADTAISNNQAEFILQALKDECRLDGRRPFDFRRIKFVFSPDDSGVTLTLGATRVMAVITAKLVPPYPDRPSEGSIRFNVEAGPMASPAFEAGRPGQLAVEVGRLVERGLKQSGALDTEALCVMAGRKVWDLRCDLHILDHEGNLVDACHLAALAAFMAFRRPDVSFGGPQGSSLVVHPPEQREPLPLTIHHLPVSVTFALYEDGDTVVVDPSRQEAAAAAGSTTLVVNTGQEVCAVQKADGVGLTQSQIMRLMRIACSKAEEMVAALKQSLQEHEVARVAARVRRAQAAAAPAAATASRHVLGAALGPALAAGGPARGMVVDGEGAGQQQQQEDGAAAQLAADLGISLPSSSSSSSSDDDSSSEGGEEGEAMEEGAARAGQGPQTAASSVSPAAGPTAGSSALGRSTATTTQQGRGGAGGGSSPAAGALPAAAKAGVGATSGQQGLPSPSSVLQLVGGGRAGGGAKGLAVEVGAGTKAALARSRSPLQSPRASGPRGAPNPLSSPSQPSPLPAAAPSQPATSAMDTPGQLGNSQAGGGGDAKRPRTMFESEDQMEQVAAVIAGAASGPRSDGPVSQLKDAVKPRRPAGRQQPAV